MKQEFSEKYIEAFDSLNFSDNTAETIEMIKNSKKPSKVKYMYFGIASIAICIIIVLVLPALIKTPDNVESTSISEESVIKGLPIDNFVSQGSTYTMASRVFSWQYLPDFFDESSDPLKNAEAFVIVRVTDTQYLQNKNVDGVMEGVMKSGRQISTLSVLQHVWGKTTVPDNFQIWQNYYGVYDPDTGVITPNTNFYSSDGSSNSDLLRNGGVYLLPLHQKTETEDAYFYELCDWIEIGIPDVLFEIDDTGRIHSHSGYKGFNIYDGLHYSALASAIVNFAESPDLPILLSNFGQTALLSAIWTTGFAQIKLTAEVPYDEMPHDFTGLSDTYLCYRATVAFDFNKYQKEDITIVYSFPSSVSATKASLNVGHRYLVANGHLTERVEYFDDNTVYKVNPEFDVHYDRVAEILPNQTIRVLSDDSFFSNYDGYTITEIMNLVYQIRNTYETLLSIPG